MSGRVRVGYRFHPTDDELVNYFLKNKMDGDDSLVDNEIRLIDLLKHEPWDLPGLAAEVSNDQIWYFFCKRELKYKNSSRHIFNRSTRTGHWKPTGIEHIVKAKGSDQKIGTKRTLVFYSRGSPKEIRTDWVIQEYQPKNVLPHQKDFVLCKLKDKTNKKADSLGSDQAESSHNKNTASGHHLLEIPTPQQVYPELLQQSLAAENEINFDNGSATQQEICIEQGISLDDFMFDGVFDEPHENLIGSGDSFIAVPDEQSGDTFVYPLSAVGLHQENLNTNLSNSYSPQSNAGVYVHDFDDVDFQIACERSMQFDASNSNSIQANSCSPQSNAGVYVHDFDDVDFQIACERSVQFDASNSNSIQANPREYRQMRRVQTITETLPPSTFNQSGMQKNHSHSNEILVIEHTDSEEINPIGEASKFATQLKTPTQPPKPTHLMAVGEAKPEQKAREATNTRTRTQNPISGQVMATAKQEGKMSIKPEHKARGARKNDVALGFIKKNITVKTEKDHKMVKAETNMTGKGNTGSFIYQETSILSQQSTPVSVYIVNSIIGLILLLHFLINSFYYPMIVGLILLIAYVTLLGEC